MDGGLSSLREDTGHHERLGVGVEVWAHAGLDLDYFLPFLAEYLSGRVS
jgi:hypothetical protein